MDLGFRITLSRIAGLALAALFGAAFLAAAVAVAQEDFVPEGETNVILDPTAWSRLRGEYAVNLGFEPFVFKGELGVLDYVTVGISYGGVGVLGSGEPNWNPRPGFLGKIRITNGGEWLPAIAAGYDDQGYGRYFKNKPYGDRAAGYNRYQYKAKGFFGVISQEIEFLGSLGLHLGVSYNLLERDDDLSADVYGGLEKSIGPYFMVLGTYDAGLNDDAEPSLGMGRGYLNGGVRWRVSDKFNCEFWAVNILENQTEKLGKAGGYTRMLYLTYVDSF